VSPPPRPANNLNHGAAFSWKFLLTLYDYELCYRLTFIFLVVNNTNKRAVQTCKLGMTLPSSTYAPNILCDNGSNVFNFVKLFIYRVYIYVMTGSSLRGHLAFGFMVVTGMWKFVCGTEILCVQIMFTLHIILLHILILDVDKLQIILTFM
jgi:hypothetical protein